MSEEQERATTQLIDSAFQKRTSVVQLAKLKHLVSVSTHTKLYQETSPLDALRTIVHEVIINNQKARAQKAAIEAQKRAQATQQKRKQLHFNLNAFIKQSYVELNQDHLRILRKDENERTEKEARALFYVVSGLKAFQKYDHELQLEICKVVRYAKYERGRLIIRQGDPARAFYFILGGSVAVTVNQLVDAHDESKGSTSKMVDILGSGDCFGEIALLNNITRQASIVTLDNTEFLIVEKEAFTDLIMQHGTLEAKKKSKFFRLIPFFFENYTPEDINTLALRGKYLSFNHNKVITRDEYESDYVYIVQEGAVIVMKEVTSMSKLGSSLSQSKSVRADKLKKKNGLEHLMKNTKTTDLKTLQNSERNTPEEPKSRRSLGRRSSLPREDSCESPDFRKDLKRTGMVRRKTLANIDISKLNLMDMQQICDSVPIITDNLSYEERESLIVSEEGSLDSNKARQERLSKPSNQLPLVEENLMLTNSTNKKPPPVERFIQVATLQPGHIFGELSLLEKLPYTKNIMVAKGKVRVISIPKTDFLRFLSPKKTTPLIEERNKWAFTDKEILESYTAHLQWDQYKTKCLCELEEEAYMKKNLAKGLVRAPSYKESKRRKGRNKGPSWYN
eukprot:Nk52_evm16s147 gene=Nk52_evmTU16s147